MRLVVAVDSSLIIQASLSERIFYKDLDEIKSTDMVDKTLFHGIILDNSLFSRKYNAPFNVNNIKAVAR